MQLTGFSVSYDCHDNIISLAIALYHLIITCNPTWCNSDWRNRIQKCHISKPNKVLDVYQTLSSFAGGVWGQDYKGTA